MSVAALLGERYGLRVDGSTTARLERVLEEGARTAGLDAAAYEARLAADADELQAVVERLTVQETAFFRHPRHFDLVARRIAGGGGGVVWSAGCANGQEAWSVAMLLEELRAPGWSVLATDLSAEAVARASAGRYAERELRGLSPARRARFLRPSGDDAWEVAPGLRERVRFARHNVATEPPPPDADGRVVLCRNVLIYLRPADADRFLERLRARMPADGLLLLGAAESLAADHPAFDAERTAAGFVHRPRAAAAAPAPAPAPARAKAPRVDAPPRRRRPSPAAPPPLPAPADLVAAGEQHAAAGRHREAAAAFRQAAYLRPEDPLAQARLGFALEAAGDGHAARRAFRAARRALAGTADGALEDQLGGWSPDELRRVVAERAGVAS